MSLAPLSGQQLAEAREWAAKLGVPEEAVIADAQAAKDASYHAAAVAANAADTAAMSRINGVGLSAYGGSGPLAEFEAEAG